MSTTSTLLTQRESSRQSPRVITKFLHSAFRLLFAQSMVALIAAGAPKALPEGKLPNDSRLEPLKDLDGYFPFKPPATKEAWDKRAERVRRQILISQGLWPMPTKTPLNAVVHGRIDRDEYTVEKVYFESVPGFFVTGNLYRPKNITGKVPGVLLLTVTGRTRGCRSLLMPS